MTDRLARPEAEPVAGPPIESVTGVATGALGTGANLDDTQRYSLDALQEPAVSAAESEAPAVEAPAVEAPELSEPPRPRVAPARAGSVDPRAPLLRASRLPPKRAGAVAVGALVVALAAILTVRDGAPSGGLGGLGVDGVAGAAGTFPPLPAAVAAGTPAPVATPNLPGGHGNGRGHGHGHH